MPNADWRSKEAYPDAKKAEAADIAWEWLRRNRGYQRNYGRLVSSERSSAMAEQFRRKWGLSFRS
ncbi:transcriptional regulator domain-containing protein [Bradyrhizobium genosp. P]|uniref:transcriptional regulator domain-containing protein n=1 Tax=Bradyrhizobium genosp. P TaxID=83641 RepID=UPI003CE99395